MKTEQQASAGRRKKKLKRPTPEPSRSGRPTPSYASYRIVTTLIIQGDIPEFNLGELAETLLMELEVDGHCLSENTYMAIMRVAACLRERHCDESTAEIRAKFVANHVIDKIIKKVKAGE